MSTAGELTWDFQAREYAGIWGLKEADVEAIVRYPQRLEMDPSTYERGYKVMRHIGGDVVVVVGYLNPASPQILYVSVGTPQEGQASGRGSTAGKGGGAGSSLPTSNRDLQRRIVDKGYRLGQDGGGHLSVLAKDGYRLMSLGSTPSDHRSIANAWRRFINAHLKYQDYLKYLDEEEEQNNAS